MPVQAKPLPGFPPVPATSPIILPPGDAPPGVSEGELGWLICLYNDQNYCIADSYNPGDVAAVTTNGIKATSNATKVAPNGTDLVILENIGEGVVSAAIFWAILNANKIYKFVKKFWYKGKHVGYAAGDGGCMGDWSYNQDSTLGSCTSAHGIYWQLQSSGSAFRMWNTYAKGDMIASNLNDGTPLFVHSPEDWSTWVGIPVCFINCD